MRRIRIVPLLFNTEVDEEPVGDIIYISLTLFSMDWSTEREYMPPPHVAASVCERYDLNNIIESLHDIFSQCGGINKYCRAGESILIKPNLLKAAAPENAVCTHPRIIEALAEIIKKQGAHPAIGDSPGWGGVKSICRRSGYMEFAEKKQIPIVEFREKKRVKIQGLVMNSVDVAAEALEFDGMINVAKCKTHGQMGMTLAVKNTFGVIVGKEKPLWHLKVKTDVSRFAGILIDIHTAVKPRFNLIDGILGMEGNGPGSGTPRHLGFIAGSDHAPALDIKVCEALNIPMKEVHTVTESIRSGLVQPDAITLSGDFGRPLQGGNPFKMAENFPLGFTGMGIIRDLARRVLTSRPRVQATACTGCGACAEICPAEAITIEKIAGIRNKDCIRCFCCQEICPEGAIYARRWF